MAREEAAPQEERFIGLLATVYPRVVALFLVLFALQYWMHLIGFYDGPEYRFDTMSGHWRAAGATLAVLFPVAAVGLWGGFSWGIVVWLLAAACETVMYFWFSDLFGSSAFTLAFHLVTIVGFFAVRVANSRLTPAAK